MVDPNQFEPIEEEITLNDADPTTIVPVTIEREKQSMLITGVRLVRTSQSGTAYDSNTLAIELWDEDPTGAPPRNHMVLRRASLEPDSLAVALHETDLNFGSVTLFNKDTPQEGTVYIKLTREGGAPGSEEIYQLSVDTYRRW